MAITIQIETSVSEFPGGVKMSPSEFAQWLAENFTFTANGDFLTGQVGGARPATNVGLYINGRNIEVWDGNAYNTLLTPPIGAMMPWPSGLLVPPDGYLFCEGQLILKADFPLLYAVVGDLFKATGDDPAFFRLPSTQGRVVVGQGTGDYNPTKSSSGVNGALKNRVLGSYYGAEWPVYKDPVQPNAPTVRYLYPQFGGKPFAGQNYTSCSQPGVVLRWLVRAK